MIIIEPSKHFLAHYTTIMLEIFDHRRIDPHSKLEMGTGWTGPKTLLNPYRFKPVVAYIQSKLPMPCSIIGWGNFILPGESIGVHDHIGSGNEFSGIYYMTEASLNIHPLGKPLKELHFQPGQIIIFPSDTKHSVSPHPEIPKVRVSVAFNAVPK